MDDAEFEALCEQIAELADKVAEGTPEQIAANAEGGWWEASNTLRQVYNDWLMGYA